MVAACAGVTPSAVIRKVAISNRDGMRDFIVFSDVGSMVG
jgi:hypothetical protein